MHTPSNILNTMPVYKLYYIERLPYEPSKLQLPNILAKVIQALFHGFKGSVDCFLIHKHLVHVTHTVAVLRYK